MRLGSNTRDPRQGLDIKSGKEYLGFMNKTVTLDDHARLPWRFYGAARAVLARL